MIFILFRVILLKKHKGGVRLFAETVEHALIDTKKEKQDIAEKIGMTRNNFYRELKKDNFKESRMREIAEALDCELVIKLVPKSTDS